MSGSSKCKECIQAYLYRSEISYTIDKIECSPAKHPAENGLIRERSECISVTLVELILELHPVETETVQEALQQVHKHQDAECDGPEDWPEDDSRSDASSCASSGIDCLED